MSDQEPRFESIDALVILAFCIMIACMRGCWHVGRIADKLTPETRDGFSPGKTEVAQ